ncbi:SAM-dependent methyltransferase [Alkalihalobacillus hwajinpoensis]|uniref:SAM-dependent methyltransferase n=1 Tax=Guptibacillus hwajinpoensis TaxID=208199 RepID=UPI00188416D4|nr:SAM-dependent methyltransferase [Pseudalkalibacillus hwajinpoensis]MBF0709255.1 SAM-dependent methyltransferase [Pseudalkalibacillus hwajinpoensis]
MKEIERSPGGAISFEKFMTLSLYHERYGYYQVNQPKTGRNGDFYTSTSVHDIFPRVMARVLIADIHKHNLEPFIVDAGSGDGNFIASFLDEVKQKDQALFHQLTYCVIEASQYHRRLIKEKVHGLNVRMYSSLSEIKNDVPILNGILLSNELLDAFPVRVVEKFQKQLYEVCVGIDHRGSFREIYKPCTDAKLIKWLNHHDVVLAEDQRFEVPLIMSDWLYKTGEWISEGKVYTIDYGYTNEEWQHPARKRGSLRGYRKHQLMEDVLRYPGEMDLTTHVSIDAIEKIGIENGLEWLECLPQGQFLLKHDLLSFIKQVNPDKPFSNEQKQNRAIRWLAESNQFLVMIQEKRQRKKDDA